MQVALLKIRAKQALKTIDVQFPASSLTAVSKKRFLMCKMNVIVLTHKIGEVPKGCVLSHSVNTQPTTELPVPALESPWLRPEESCRWKGGWLRS